MRSSEWQYLGYVSAGFGLGLVVSGVISLFYMYEHGLMRHRYGSYLLPLLSIGLCFLIAGLAASFVARERRLEENKKSGLLPPPPPPPPPV